MNPTPRHSKSFCTLDNPKCTHSKHSIVPFVASQDETENCPSCPSRTSLLPRTTPKNEPAPSESTSVVPVVASPEVSGVRIDPGKSMTLMLRHRGECQLITLPTDKLDQNKRYRATFTIKKIEGTSIEPKSEKFSLPENIDANDIKINSRAITEN